MLTNTFAQKQLDELAERGVSREKQVFMKEIFFVFYENAQFFLDCIRLEYGSVANYLELVLGVGPKEIETLEKYYLE